MNDNAIANRRSPAYSAALLFSIGCLCLCCMACSATAGTVVSWGQDIGADAPAGDYVGIAAGGDHGLAIKADQTVVAWGGINYNEGQARVPPALSGILAITAGQYHSLALRSDGTAVGWGFNIYGQASPPVGTFISISGGDAHSIGLTPCGTVVSWGGNQFSPGPAPAGLTDVISISAGQYHNLALKSDGTVVAWGTLYLDDYGFNAVPAYVPAGLTGVVAIAAGFNHDVALLLDGSLVAWGKNNYFQTVAPSGSYTAISAGYDHTLALAANGSVVAWGDNRQGQLNVPAGTYSAIAAGGRQSLAIAKSGLQPNMVIEHPPGTALVRLVNLGPVVSGIGRVLTFVIRNQGSRENVTGLAITKATSGTPADFTVSPLQVTTLPPGAGTSFTVTFAPGGTGNRTSSLQVTNNDSAENPFIINLAGRQATPLEVWRQTYFGTVENTCVAADLNDPDGDGIANLMEYAAGTDPLKPTPTPWSVVKTGNNLEFTCPRRKAALDEMTFELEASVFDSTWHTLPSASVTILSDDGVMQQVKYTTPAGTAGKRFVRLRVTRL